MSFPLACPQYFWRVVNPSGKKKDCGQAAMTENIRYVALLITTLVIFKLRDKIDYGIAQKANL
jgi:hypothetical protein